MSASKKLRELMAEEAIIVVRLDPTPLHVVGGPTPAAVTLRDALPLIADVVEAAERRGDGVSVIRALGFVGNSHYCPSCLNTFHDDCGQHKPDCQSLAEMMEDDEWPDFMPMPALTALQEHLEGGDVT